MCTCVSTDNVTKVIIGTGDTEECVPTSGATCTTITGMNGYADSCGAFNYCKAIANAEDGSY